MCTSHTLLPRSLHFELPRVSWNSHPTYSGGFANVFKREDHGREVAVKILRIYKDKGFLSSEVLDVGCRCWVCVHVGIDELSRPFAEIL